MSGPKGAPILLLEDERATAALVVQLLAGERITNPVESIDSGEEALAFLEGVVLGTTPMPVLCVLDLSLPGVSGLEVLRHIRRTPEIAHLKVIMLTGSGNDATARSSGPVVPSATRGDARYIDALPSTMPTQSVKAGM